MIYKLTCELKPGDTVIERSTMRPAWPLHYEVVSVAKTDEVTEMYEVKLREEGHTPFRFTCGPNRVWVVDAESPMVATPSEIDQPLNRETILVTDAEGNEFYVAIGDLTPKEQS